MLMLALCVENSWEAELFLNFFPYMRNDKWQLQKEIGWHLKYET